MRYFGWHPMMGSLFGFGWIITIVFWVLVIWLIIAMVRQAKTGHKSEESDEALKILKKRYAKGEITKKEFAEMKKDIS